VIFAIEPICFLLCPQRTSFVQIWAFYMLSTSRGVADDEVKAAADYFSKLELKQWIKVANPTLSPRLASRVACSSPPRRAALSRLVNASLKYLRI
jgi:hypothetical protein